MLVIKRSTKADKLTPTLWKFSYSNRFCNIDEIIFQFRLNLFETFNCDSKMCVNIIFDLKFQQ